MMRLGIATAVLILLVLAADSALAQEKSMAKKSEYEGTISPGELTPTPEMWFYQQYQREYQDPKMAVRKKAEARALQRQQRVACLKWFGFSNVRPQVSSDPFNGDWSPCWKSNNLFYPDRWQGVGQSWVVIRPAASGTWVY
ncbi:MAG: hypothetical protein A2V70_17180 [Planctomycetes bacterium RBG_13_63_9]|nr:MAG: hypothetical protein A2V70_17180 [Planctomycetes bacterium RBG_13_63_9]